MAESMIFPDPVSVREASKLLNVSPTRVQQLKKEGRLKTDDKGKLSLSEIQSVQTERNDGINLERPINSEDAFERRKIAEASFAEYRSELTRMELAMKSGELVETTQVIRDAQEVAEAICHTLDTLPSRLASRLIGQSEVGITVILQDEMEALKRQIKSGRFVCPDETSEETSDVAEE